MTMYKYEFMVNIYPGFASFNVACSVHQLYELLTDNSSYSMYTVVNVHESLITGQCSWDR